MATKPAIPAVTDIADPGLQRILQAMKERIENLPSVFFYGHPIFIDKKAPASNPTGQYLWLELQADGRQGAFRLWLVVGSDKTMLLSGG